MSSGSGAGANTASQDVVVTYTASPAVEGKKMLDILADNSVTWVTASHISDWHAVTAVKVQYQNLVKNATTRVLLQ